MTQVPHKEDTTGLSVTLAAKRFGAIGLVFGPPVLWFLISSLEDSSRIGPGPAPITGPLTYLGCILGVGVVILLVAAIFRCRSVVSIKGAGSVAGAGALMTLVLSLVLAFGWIPFISSSGNQWEPTLFADQTLFYKKRSRAYGSPINHTGAGDFVVRRSWRLDEYGIRPDETTEHYRREYWILPWEEYGFPLRCLSIPQHYGWPRPRGKDLYEWTPRIMLDLAIDPLPFSLNTLLFGGVAFFLVRGRHIVQRACRGQCAKCGHQLTMEQVVCPECGRPVKPIDRLFVRQGPQTEAAKGNEEKSERG